MAKVEFAPSGKIIELRSGESILDAARRADLPMANSCDGEGACGGCRIVILEGAETLPQPSKLEKSVMKTYGYRTGERAACLIWPEADLKVTTGYW
jgi:ferredoxin